MIERRTMEQDSFLFYIDFYCIKRVNDFIVPWILLYVDFQDYETFNIIHSRV